MLWLAVLRVVAAAPEILARSAGIKYKGVWTYEAVGDQATDLGKRYDQYIYSSNGGPGGDVKACTHTVTVYTPLCWMSSWLAAYSGTPTDNSYVMQEKLAIPDSFEMLAVIVDELNERGTDADGVFLADTCLQFSTTAPNGDAGNDPYRRPGYGGDYFITASQSFMDMVNDAVRTYPPKHGIISAQHQSQNAVIARAAANNNLPNIGTYGFFSVDEPPPAHTSTSFAIKGPKHPLFGLILTTPEEATVGVLLDAISSEEFGPTVSADLKRTGRKIGLQKTIDNYSRANPGGAEPLMQVFVEDALRQKLRYILLYVADPEALAVFACVLWKMNAMRFFVVITSQVVAYASIYIDRTTCKAYMDPAHKEYSLSADVAENNGWLGTVNQVVATTPDEDLLINVATGSPGRTEEGAIDMNGDPWTDKHNAAFMAVVPTEECKDDEDALTADPLFQKLLGHEVCVSTDPSAAEDSAEMLECKSREAGLDACTIDTKCKAVPSGARITCQDVAVFGQSKKFLWVQYVADYCPITACQWNSNMPACRIACSCRLGNPLDADGAPAMMVNAFPGMPDGWYQAHPDLCADISHIEGPFSPFQQDPKYFRCEGKSCRTLAYGNPPTTQGLQGNFANQWAYSARMTGGAYPGFCRGRSCGNFAYAGVFRLLVPAMADALYAHTMAFRCWEKRHGDMARLAANAYGDHFVGSELTNCLLTEVDFEGQQGHINFGWHRQLPPGYVLASLDNDQYLGAKNGQAWEEVDDGAGGTTVAAVAAKGSTGGGAWAILKNGPVALKWRISIPDWKQCSPYKGDFAPGRTCPEGDTPATKTMTYRTGDDEAVRPKTGPSVCDPGFYSLDIGEDEIYESGANGSKVIVPWSWDRCVPCPAGTKKAGTGIERCTPCEPGFYSEPGQTKCSACAAMFYSEDPALGSNGRERKFGFSYKAGKGLMDESFVTTSQMYGATQCLPCPDGQYSGIAAFECETCAPGSGLLIPGVSTACTKCPRGSFDAGSECETCPEGMTTFSDGSVSINYCTCEQGSYWNRRGVHHDGSQPENSVCSKCPQDAYCAGGLTLPVVFAGKWGKYVGDVSAATIEAQDQAYIAGNYDFGNYKEIGGAFSDIMVYNCLRADLCVADPPASYFNHGLVGGSVCTNAKGMDDSFAKCTVFTSTADCSADSECSVIFQKEGVRFGAPLDSTCEDLNREGIACGKCKDGSFGRVFCDECQAGASAFNVIIVLILPFALWTLYAFTVNKASGRITGAFVLASTMSMGAFFLQTIAVLGSFNMNWPVDLDWLFALAKLLMFDFNGVSFGCWYGDTFAAKYWVSIVLPIVIMVATVIAYPMSQFVKQHAMKMNPTISMLGMIYSALYISLTKIVLGFFECPANPNAPGTLAMYKDVHCNEDDNWGSEYGPDAQDKGSATGAMVVGMILYCIGLYTATFWAAVVAPRKWDDNNFRERFKFLLQRWRPDTWYWGFLVMTRNFLVATAGLIAPADAEIQLMFTVVVVTIFMSATACASPWRSSVLTNFDVCTSVLLIIIGAYGLVFMYSDTIETLYRRQGLIEEADNLVNDLKGHTKFLFAVIGVFISSFFLLLGWCINMMRPTVYAALICADKKRVSDVVMIMKAEMNDSLLPRLETMLSAMSFAEYEGFYKVLVKLAHGDEATLMKERGSGVGGSARVSQNATDPAKRASIKQQSEQRLTATGSAAVQDEPAGQVVSA